MSPRVHPPLHNLSHKSIYVVGFYCTHPSIHEQMTSSCVRNCLPFVIRSNVWDKSCGWVRSGSSNDSSSKKAEAGSSIISKKTINPHRHQHNSSAFYWTLKYSMCRSKSEETKVDENPINLQVRFGHVCKTRSYLYIDDNLLGLPWRRPGHIHVACAKPSGYRCRWHSVVYTIAAPTSSSCMKSLQGGKLGGLVHENVLAFGEFSIQNQMSAVNINF